MHEVYRCVVYAPIVHQHMEGTVCVNNEYIPGMNGRNILLLNLEIHKHDRV